MEGANPPDSFGKAMVHAHALTDGASGNIAPYSINGSCCTRDGTIVVENVSAFSGGRDAQTYSFVQQSDIDGAGASLLNPTVINARSLLTKQIRSNETLYPQSVQCKHVTVANPDVNGRTTTTTITVYTICTGNVYDNVGASSTASLQLKAVAFKQLAKDYALKGDIKTDFMKVVSADVSRGIIVLLLKLEGLWIFQLNDARRQALVQLIAGKNDKQAFSLLLKQEGVAGVRIQIPSWVPLIIRSTLPADIHHIRLVVAHF